MVLWCQVFSLRTCCSTSTDLVSPTGSTCIPRMTPWSSYPDSVGATGLLILCFAKKKKKKCFMILVTCVKLLNDPNSFCSISGGTAGWTRIWISLALRKYPVFFGGGTSWEVLWWKLIISLFCIVTRYSNTLLAQQLFACLIENVLPKIQLQQLLLKNNGGQNCSFPQGWNKVCLLIIDIFSSNNPILLLISSATEVTTSRPVCYQFRSWLRWFRSSRCLHLKHSTTKHGNWVKALNLKINPCPWTAAFSALIK